jgi:cyanophycin synthetase
MAKLARVKAVVAHSTADDGYAILNADDDRVYKLSGELDCNIALFSTEEKNDRIREHCAGGGIAAIVEKGYFTLCKGNWRTRVAKVEAVPLTLGGKADCMIKNVLPSILAAVIHGFEMEVIRKALQSFIPSEEYTPGRMNLFKFPGFSVMVDYAHNRDGFCQLEKFLDQTPASVKVGIIASPGDRRDEDIRQVGMQAATIFDELIIKHDKDGRGRTNDEITQLLKEGIDQKNPLIPVTVISDEIEAIQYAIDAAREDSFIVVCTEKVRETLAYVKGRKELNRVSV